MPPLEQALAHYLEASLGWLPFSDAARREKPRTLPDAGGARLAPRSALPVA
jgi:hypothetical protein